MPGGPSLGPVQTVELVVHDVAVGGDGIARGDDGRVVFVPGAAVGDRLRATIVEDRDRYRRAQVEAILEPGPGRIEPPCPEVARGCGGCGWQHLAVGAQRAAKIRLAEESLRRLGRLQARVDPGPELPDLAFRTTVRAAVDDEGRAGFRMARSHAVVHPERCLVAHPRLDEILVAARFPGASEVTLRISASTGYRLALVAGRCRPLDVPHGVDVVDVGDRLGMDEAHLVETVAGVPLRVSARSFFQSRTDGAEALVGEVRAAAAGAPDGPMVDLYGGVGLFAATVGSERDSVTVVEQSPWSGGDARINLPGAEVVIGSVERWRPTPAALVVADPPRKGLGRPGVGVVAATGASRVVTIHCDAASFGRDAGLMASSGYRLESTVLVDLFPHTPHVELVSRFTRSG